MMARVLAGLAALALMAGCGALGGGGGGQGVMAAAGQLVPGLGGGNRFERAAQRPGFTPQDIAQNVGAYMFIGVPTMGPPVPARLIRDNAGDRTYDVQVGFTAAFRDGLLVATRGLGEDLMGADVSQVAAALQAGGGTAIRRMDYLGANDETITLSFTCTVSAAGTEEVDLGLRRETLRKFSENCSSDLFIFENLYWLDGSGTILSSRQLVSETVAYLRGNLL